VPGNRAVPSLSRRGPFNHGRERPNARTRRRAGDPSGWRVHAGANRAANRARSRRARRPRRGRSGDRHAVAARRESPARASVTPADPSRRAASAWDRAFRSRGRSPWRARSRTARTEGYRAALRTAAAFHRTGSAVCRADVRTWIASSQSTVLDLGGGSQSARPRFATYPAKIPRSSPSDGHRVLRRTFVHDACSFPTGLRSPADSGGHDPEDLL
jgi:hypothetical protein